MADFEAALKYINSANVSEYYVAPADDKMSLETLQANKQRLIDQIKLWNDRYGVGNSTEKSNITKLLDVQNKKLSGYNLLIDVWVASETPAPAAQGTTTDKAGLVDETGTPAKQTSASVANAGGAAGAAKKKPDWMLIGGIALAVIIIGGAVWYKMKHKKA